MEQLLEEIIRGAEILDKKEGHNWQLERGIGSKAYVVKRIDLLREQLLELKKSL